MKYVLFGAGGGIGSAIKEALSEHEQVLDKKDVDWLIFAQGFIGEDDMQETFLVNTMFCIKQTEQYISHLKQGVIYISSTAALGSNDRFPIYAASKAAVNSYTKSMAKKYPALQFYALCPGPTDTKMWRDLELEGNAQPPSAVADVVKKLMEIGSSETVLVIRDSELLCP